MNHSSRPPGNGRPFRHARAAGLALALAALPGCFLAYRPAEPPVPAPHPAPSRDSAVALLVDRAEAAFDAENVPEGIFHVVQSGQTLWRIARGYGVSIDSIVAANGIVDPETIELGRALFVPGARSTIDIAPFPAPPPRPPAAVADIVGSTREWVWPVTGQVLSRFGVPRQNRTHRGVDIRGRRGEEVVAARAGRIVFAGRGGGGYGLTVVIDHGEGRQSLYAHNESLLVAVGDHVAQGQPVARCGRTGNATTEHVHFEIRENDVPRDPLPLLGEILEARR